MKRHFIPLSKTSIFDTLPKALRVDSSTFDSVLSAKEKIPETYKKKVGIFFFFFFLGFFFFFFECMLQSSGQKATFPGSQTDYSLKVTGT